MTAHYYYFNPAPSTKWKYDGEGASIPHNLWDITHDKLAALNGGQMPGISSDGKSYTIVIIDPESWPRMIFAERERG